MASQWIKNPQLQLLATCNLSVSSEYKPDLLNFLTPLISHPSPLLSFPFSIRLLPLLDGIYIWPDTLTLLAITYLDTLLRNWSSPFEPLFSVQSPTYTRDRNYRQKSKSNPNPRGNKIASKTSLVLLLPTPEIITSSSRKQKATMASLTLAEKLDLIPAALLVRRTPLSSSLFSIRQIMIKDPFIQVSFHF